MEETAFVRSWRRPQAWWKRRAVTKEGRGRVGVREASWVPLGIAGLQAAAL